MKLFKPIFKHWSYLADLVVIILGIVIALSLDAWWQNRQDRKLEQHYLEQLYVDFKETDKTLTAYANITNNRFEKIIYLINAIHDGSEFSHDTIPYILFEGLSSLPFAIQDGTFRSLIHSGHIALIQNDSIRTQLASYQGRIDVDIQKLQSDYIFLKSIQLDSFFINEISASNSFPNELKAGFGVTSNNRFPVDYTALINDRRFESLIANLGSSKLDEIGFYSRIINHTKVILHLLEAELGIEPTE